MLKHEFYADPTIFDQWQNSTGSWLSSRLQKLSPYSWVIAFSAVAIIFLLVALGVFAYSLQQGVIAGNQPGWNHSLAQGVTVVIALLACQGALKQALHAWPQGVDLPSQFGFLQRLVTCHRRTQAMPATATAIPLARAKVPDNSVDAQAVREFFAAVRKAGVSVTIAKALFAAGVRSAHHLRAVDDKQLLAIKGVGAATVRRLRVYFGH
jgi:hypothetical protein